LVRRALRDVHGREVKHTGDGIMASFDEVPAAVECARAIQRTFDAFNLASTEKLRVRIGLDAGEPFVDSNDLFGTTVNLAARICETAGPERILVSEIVHGRLPDTVPAAPLGPQRLRGFAEPVPLFEVAWR